jgi:hypothetical protein
VKINLENQQNVSRLREEMMFRMYENNEAEEYNEVENSKLVSVTNQQGCKMNDP